jgi:hypothetical protein
MKLSATVKEAIADAKSKSRKKKPPKRVLADAHHDRSIPEEQRGVSRHGTDSYLGIAHGDHDQGPHRQAAHGPTHTDLKEVAAEDVRHDA